MKIFSRKFDPGRIFERADLYLVSVVSIISFFLALLWITDPTLIKNPEALVYFFGIISLMLWYQSFFSPVPQPPKHRPYVEWIADRIEEALERKEALNEPEKYGPWELDSHQQRCAHCMLEITELSEAIAECVCEEKRTPEKILHMQREAYDVANTAMMLAAGFDAEMIKLRRGREI